MKMLTALALAVAPALLALSAAAEAATCVYPQAPQSLPNGAAATKEEMLAAQAVVKEYAKNVQETYLSCLDQDQAEQLAALDPADPQLAEKKTAVEAIHAKKHNSALDELQAVVDRWNVEKKAYSEKAAK
jgi:hypothetical protein